MLEVPAVEFVGEGGLTLENEAVHLTLVGREPEQAKGIVLETRFSATGEIFGTLAAAEPDAEPFVRIRSGLPVDRLELHADIQLAGFALDLVSAIAELPPGTGKLGGQFQVSYPWPLSEDLDLELLELSGPFSANWSTADGGVAAGP